MAKDPVIVLVPKVPAFNPVTVSRRGLTLLACSLCGSFVNDATLHAITCPAR